MRAPYNYIIIPSQCFATRCQSFFAYRLGTPDTKYLLLYLLQKKLYPQNVNIVSSVNYYDNLVYPAHVIMGLFNAAYFFDIIIIACVFYCKLVYVEFNSIIKCLYKHLFYIFNKNICFYSENICQCIILRTARYIFSA